MAVQRRRGRHRAGGARISLAAIVVAGGLLAACGTRLPDSAFDAQRRPAPTTGGSSSTAGRTATGGSNGSPAGPSAGSTGGDAVETTGGTGRAAGAGSSAPGGSGAAVPNQASDVGVTATTIRIGTIVAEQGVLGDAFAPPLWGLQAWVAYTNAHGGIAGRTIQLFSCDDREDRTRDLHCAQQLVEQDKVFALIGTNTRADGGSAAYLDEHAIPVMGIPITNTFNRYRHFFSAYGSSYPRDSKQVGYGGQLEYGSTDYKLFKDRLGASKAAVFGYDIAESSQAVDLFAKGLELEGYAVKKYLVSFAAPSFDGAVASMQRDGTQLVADAMDPGANAKLCDAMQRRGFRPLVKLTQIDSMGEDAIKQLNDVCRNATYVSGSTRPYTDTSVPFIATFRAAMARYEGNKPLHEWALEAWVMADQLRQALVAMGPKPTRAGFEAFLLRPQGVDVPGVIPSPDKWSYDPSGAVSGVVAHSCTAMAKWDDGAPGGWTSFGGFPACVSGSHNYLAPVQENGD